MWNVSFYSLVINKCTYLHVLVKTLMLISVSLTKSDYIFDEVVGQAARGFIN